MLPLIAAAGEALATEGAAAAEGTAMATARGATMATRAASVAETATSGASAASRGTSFLGQARQAAAQQAPYLLQQKLAAVEQRTSSPQAAFHTPIDSWLPSFNHTIFVGVNGGPTATLKDIWLLALATAFGRLRAKKVGSSGAIIIDGIWDITDKQVGVRISYEASGLSAVITQEILDDKELRPLQVFTSGPSEETTGGDWPDFLLTFPKTREKRETARAMGGRLTPQKMVTTDVDADVSRRLQLQADNYLNFKILPDDGRIITTGIKTNPDIQPPKPSDVDVLALVSAALLDPCYMVSLPATSRQVPPGTPPLPPIYPPGETTTELRGGLLEIIPRDGTQLETTQTQELRSGENPFGDIDGYDRSDWGEGDGWF